MPVVIPTASPAPLPTNVSPGTTIFVGNQLMLFTGTQWVSIGYLASTPEDTEMTEFRVSHKSYNVNTKRIQHRIVDTVREIALEYIFQRATSLSKTYDYTQLIDYMELYMGTLVDDKEIVTYDIIGDHRNNDIYTVCKGTINLEVAYQQFNCLNTTKLVFLIERV